MAIGVRTKAAAFLRALSASVDRTASSLSEILELKLVECVLEQDDADDLGVLLFADPITVASLAEPLDVGAYGVVCARLSDCSEKNLPSPGFGLPFCAHVTTSRGVGRREVPRVGQAPSPSLSRWRLVMMVWCNGSSAFSCWAAQNTSLCESPASSCNWCSRRAKN
jgi:hypothetical protein